MPVDLQELRDRIVKATVTVKVTLRLAVGHSFSQSVLLGVEPLSDERSVLLFVGKCKAIGSRGSSVSSVWLGLDDRALEV
jgi:hypothetical protein